MVRVIPKKLAKSFRRFDNFKFVVRGPKKIASAIAKNNALKKAVKSVFTKKGVLIVAGAAGIGYAVDRISNYIDANSGCFQISSDDGSVECKVQSLSCCHKDVNSQVPFCPGRFVDPCGNDFDEEKEQSCCRLCDCKVTPCPAGKELECRRATLSEALSYYAAEMMLPFGNFLFNVAVFVLIGTLGTLAIAWLVRYLFWGRSETGYVKLVDRRRWEKNNDDNDDEF